MNSAIWGGQILLALVFLMAGVWKATQPKEKLVENLAWVENFSPNTIRLIGIVELLGAIGVVLPAVTGILPWLTPWAATGLELTMIGAAVTHLRRGEYASIAVNIALLALAAFVAYGRFILIPMQ